MYYETIIGLRGTSLGHMHSYCTIVNYPMGLVYQNLLLFVFLEIYIYYLQTDFEL